jgi:NAD(P)-binding Rossmann-like domain
MTRPTIHVVGGGIAGLVAAITAAEGDAGVVLHEAAPQLGGRARSGDGPYGVNLGPHVIYRGALTRFLRDHAIDREVPTRRPRPHGIRIVDEDGVHGPAAALMSFLATQHSRDAPADADFSRWATSTFGERIGTQLCQLAGLSTFHHEPGSLSADFVWSRCRRTLGRPDTMRYITGGWSSLIGALERASRARGVEIVLGEQLDSLPSSGPTIVAVPLRPASALLDVELAWPSARTALLDLALAGTGRLAALVLDASPDLRGCSMAERLTAVDRSLAPAGVELVQAQLGVGAHVQLDDAVIRMEQTVDALGDWRSREVWRWASIVEGASGAVDPVGTTWRDRPAIDRGESRYLAGDSVAAPGLLSEVSVNSGVRAAQLALRDARQRQWAPGWPAVDLSPSMRAAVLTSAIPGATAKLEQKPWTVEPVAEVEPLRAIRQRRRSISIAEVDGDNVLTVTLPRGDHRSPSRHP